METIDLTPTWGEIGLLYTRLAESGETKAITGMRGEVARAFAASQALTAIMGDLPDELRDRARRVIGEELAKQGFSDDRQASDNGQVVATNEKQRAAMIMQAEERAFQRVTMPDERGEP